MLRRTASSTVSLESTFCAVSNGILRIHVLGPARDHPSRRSVRSLGLLRLPDHDVDGRAPVSMHGPSLLNVDDQEFSSPWPKGLFVSRGSGVQNDVLAVFPTTNPADRVAPGPQSGAHAPSSRSGGRAARTEARRRGRAGSAACPPSVRCGMSKPRLKPQTLTSGGFKMMGCPRRCTRRIPPVS